METERDEVLIIGAGVIGLACAWYLLRAGRGVRVIDRVGVGAGSSHGNCGTLTPSHAPPLAAPGVLAQGLRGMLHADSPLYVRPRLDPALAGWLWRFARRCNRRDWLAATQGRAALLNASRVLIAELVAGQGLDCEYSSNGLVYAVRDPARWRRLQAEADDLRAVGIEVDAWSGEQLLAEEPALLPGVAGGMHFPADAQLRPDRYVAELARIVRAAGGVIDSGAAVVGIDPDEGELRLDDGRGLRAERIIVATGAWTPALLAPLGIRAPIQPGKGYSITYSRPPLVPRRPLVLKDPQVCVTAWDSGFRLGSTMEFSGYDSRLTPARVEALVRGARQFLKTPEGPQRLETWCGWRPMTWDDLPLIGPAPRHPRLLLACGHGMLGVSMSAATGQLVADLLCGRSPCVDPTPYDPVRFRR
ncbi:MAG: FAD-dependent oxidoreductase [Lysobacteraceae bacterium]